MIKAPYIDPEQMDVPSSEELPMGCQNLVKQDLENTK